MALLTDGNRPAQTACSGAASRSEGGFTLVELLTVISIVGILMGIGVPSYRYITNSNRLSTEVNGLLGDMQLARSEAIKEGQSVTACPTLDGTTCVVGQHWEGGWIVFTDFNHNGVIEAGDTVLRVQKAFPGSDTFVVNSNAVNFVSFNREGFAIGLPTTGNITFILHATPNSTQWTRCLDVAMVGMMTTERAGTAGCT